MPGSSPTGANKLNGPVNKLSQSIWEGRFFPAKLANTNTGPLGHSNSGRLPVGVNSTSTPGQGTPSDKVLTREHGTDIHRGISTVDERGNYRDTHHSAELCLSDIPGGEKGWGPTACNKPEVSQSLCKNRALQDGRPPSAPKSTSATRLDGEAGLEGCLTSDSNSPRPSTPPNISVGRQVLHVQMSPIWPVISTKGVHKVTETCGGLSEANWVPPNNISGRHSNYASEQGTAATTYPINLPAVQEPRADGEPKEINNNTHTGVGIPGIPGMLSFNETIHSLRETSENKTGCPENVRSTIALSERDSKLCGEDYSHHKSYPTSPFALSSSPDVDEFDCVSQLFPGGNNQEIQHNTGTESRQQSRPELVGISDSNTHGSTGVHPQSNSNSALRCIQQGLGCSTQWENADGGCMVSRGGNPSHQLSGVAGSLPCNQSIREDLEEHHSITSHRQHDCSELHQSERRHNLKTVVSTIV